jgi:hypothetical protein
MIGSRNTASYLIVKFDQSFAAVGTKILSNGRCLCVCCTPQSLFATSLMTISATARKLKALIIGADAGAVTSDSVIADLKAASVPITSADCRICPDPCDQGAFHSDGTCILF